MRIRWTHLLLATAFLTAPLARADTDYDNTVPNQDTTQKQAPGTTGDNTGTTTAQANEVTRGVFASPFTVTPAVGALGFADGQNNYTSRILEGFLADYDFGGLLMPTTSRASFGIQSGILYSHVGSTGSNFFGANSATNVNAGANSFLLPIEFMAGYSFNDQFRGTLNFGTNMLYRSVGNSMIVGRPGDSQTNSVDFFPSVGLSASWALGPVVAITLRGDFIPVSAGAQDMYTAALGATFPIA